MFKIITFCLVLIISVTQLSAQFKHHEKEITGPKPVAIYGKDLNVFCLGHDGGEWGSKDEGDTDPSWRRVTKIDVPVMSTETKVTTETIREFDFNTLFFPFRPGVDKNQENIFMRVGDRIHWYNLSTGELVDDNILEVPAISIKAFQAKLYICVGNGSENGMLLIQNIQSKEILDTLETGINPVDCRVYMLKGKERVAILSNGPYGEEESLLQIYEKDPDGDYLLLTTIEKLGEDANHLALGNEILIATMNGSHNVIFFNFDTGEILKTVDLPTSGWDGPRETHVYSDFQSYLTTAFDGNIYMYNPFKSEDFFKVESDGKPEGIHVGEFGIYVCNPFKKGTYDPDSTVSKYGNVSGLEEQVEILRGINIFPNPAIGDQLVKIHIHVPKKFTNK